MHDTTTTKKSSWKLNKKNVDWFDKSFWGHLAFRHFSMLDLRLWRWVKLKLLKFILDMTHCLSNRSFCIDADWQKNSQHAYEVLTKRSDNNNCEVTLRACETNLNWLWHKDDVREFFHMVDQKTDETDHRNDRLAASTT